MAADGSGDLPLVVPQFLYIYFECRIPCCKSKILILRVFFAIRAGLFYSKAVNAIAYGNPIGSLQEH